MTAGATWTMPPEIIPDAQARWERVDRAIKQGLLAGEIRIQTALKTYYLSGNPIFRRKGNLSRAVFIEPTSIDNFTGYRGYVFIGPEAPYAKWLNDGTDPYIIRSKKPGGVLRFETGGEVIYRRGEVHHPGLWPRRFMESALRENTDAIVDDIGRRVNAALAG